jgi:hypothetical protein
VLNTKANFISQLRAGARGVRVAEDIDSPLPEAATIKAAATGDPRIMEHAELMKEVRELEAALFAVLLVAGAASLTAKKLPDMMAEAEQFLTDTPLRLAPSQCEAPGGG